MRGAIAATGSTSSLAAAPDTAGGSRDAAGRSPGGAEPAAAVGSGTSTASACAAGADASARSVHTRHPAPTAPAGAMSASPCRSLRSTMPPASTTAPIASAVGWP